MNKVTKKWNDLFFLSEKLEGEKLDIVCQTMEDTANFLINGNDKSYKNDIETLVFPVIVGLMTKRSIMVENHIELCDDLDIFITAFKNNVEKTFTVDDTEAEYVNDFIESYEKFVNLRVIK